MTNLWLNLHKKDVTLFEKLFDKKMSDYYDGVFGLDIVKLDKDLGTPDGVSMREHVEKIYGNEAVELIERII